MGRRSSRADEARGPEASGGPAEGRYEISSGMAELIREPEAADSWLLKINGVQSSHVVVGDPLRLDFEYMRWMAALIGSRWEPEEKLRVLHLGGGACSMARYLAAAYPQARQVVVEIDAKLADLVRRWFDIPRAPLVRIRVGEARAVTESLSEDSRDLLIRDVFSGSTTPEALTTLEFTRAVRRVLAPGGVYVVNCGDTPQLAGAREEAATIGEVFEHLVMIADPPMLKGRRHGNVVIAASDQPLETGPPLIRELLHGAVPAQLWDGARIAQFCRGSAIRQDPPVI